MASSRWAEGEPTARLTDDGLLVVQPTGDSSDLYLSMTVERWRDLNTAVEVAIAKAEKPTAVAS
jgi:hypothetical protein